MQIVAILLAAGASTRFHADKLHAGLDGRELYRHALDSLCKSSEIAQVIVVVSPDFAIAPGYDGCRFVVNSNPSAGMSSSICTGIEAAPSAEAFIFALADMPAIKPAHISALVRHYNETGKKIIVPTYLGKNGHPVLMNTMFRDELLRLEGDIGAREVIWQNEQFVAFLETGDQAVVFDVDTPEDLCARKY